MPRREPDPAALRRQQAGRYATGDGRFTVEQSSGGWMLTDGERTNELGLPLVRGPFATLDEARAAIDEARTGPAPASDLAARIAAAPRRPPRAGENTVPGRAGRRAGAPPGPRRGARDTTQRSPEPPPVVVREWRRGDGDALRRLWDAVGMHSIGDDDDGLAAMARRNPGLLLVATAGGEVVGSALAGWDGRRGWLYHVAVAPDQRRQGLARRLVAQLEDRLRAVGCRKVNVLVVDDNPEGLAFWEATGYRPHATRQLGHELRPGDPRA